MPTVFGQSVGGSTDYRIKSINTATISAGASGTILDVTATGDDLLFLYTLGGDSNAFEAGMSFTVDGNPLITGLTLAPSVHPNFSVYWGVQQGRAFTDSKEKIYHFDGVVCKNFQVIKDTGSTLASITYGYHIMEKLV